LILRSPAKVNLGLWVGKRRPDGYHEIITIIVPLRLSDRIILSTAESGIEVTADSKDVPKGPANLAFQAADRFFSATGIKSGCRIKIKKSIPVGTGLGGGSSNAATVLLGLNRIFDYPLSSRRLHKLALELGSDVPALVCRSPCVARGQGEKLRPIHLPRLNIILHLPGYPVSTSWAYDELDKFRPKPSLTSPKPCPKMVALRLRRKELASLAGRVRNSFEPVIFAHHPDLAKAKQILLGNGCYLAMLSGSGSTVYGLVETKGSQDPMAALIRHGFHCVETYSI